MRLRTGMVMLAAGLCCASSWAGSTGCVFSRLGVPIAGAEIRVYAPETRLEQRRRLISGAVRQEIARSQSDAAGAFSLDRDCQAGDEVQVVMPGYATLTRRAVGAHLGSFVLQEAETVAGSVHGPDGRPLAGAIVTWSQLWTGESTDTVTDASGRFELSDFGDLGRELVVSHPAFGVVSLSRRGEFDFPGRRPSFDLTLEETRWASGTVADEEGPVSGAEVLVDGWPLGRSDEAGRFKVPIAGAAEITVVDGDRVATTDSADGDQSLVLEKGRRVRGRITGEGGGRQRVVVVDLREQRIRADVFSAADGSFEFSALPAAVYAVYVNAPRLNLSPDSGEADLRRDASVDLRFSVVARKLIEGVVVDEAGTPLPAAQISLAREEEPVIVGIRGGVEPRLTFSDCEGRFSLPRPEEPGRLRIVVVKRGFAPGVLDLAAVGGGGGPLTVTLAAEPVIRGRVETARGVAVAGAEIAVLRSGDWVAGYPTSLLFQPRAAVQWLYESEEDGSFQLPLGAGEWDIAFGKQGYIATLVEGVDLANRDGAPVVVRLEAAAAVHGQVLREDSTPASGATVMFYGEAMQQTRAEVDELGRFQAEGLEPARYQVRAYDEETGARVSTVVEVPTGPLTLVPPTAYLVRGRVVDDGGQEVAGATVSAKAVGRRSEHSESESTDESGGFVLKGLEAGSYRLEVAAEGYLPDRSHEVRVGGGASSDEVAVSLSRGLSISGTVVDDRGEAAADVSVEVTETASSDVGWVHGMSDEAGEFEITGLPPGAISVRFEKEGFAPARRRVVLDEGENRLEVELSPGHTLRGTVVDEQGAAVADAMISLEQEGADEQFEAASSDDDGAFEVAGLVAGSFKLSALAPGYRQTEIEHLDPVERASVTVVLERQPTGTVFGTVSGVDDPRMVQVTAEGSSDEYSGRSDSAQVGRDGSYRIEDAPAGLVSVTAYEFHLSRNRSRVRQAELSPGGELRVDFDFSGGSEVQGRVGRAGRPIAGAALRFDSGVFGSVGAITDADGQYRVELDDGSYEVQVSDPRGSRQSRALEVDGPTVFNIDLDGATVRGRVVEQETGDPVPGATITVEPLQAAYRDMGRVNVETGSTGSFTVDELVAVPYLVIADHPDYAQSRVTVELTAGQIRDVQLVLEKVEGMKVRLVDARSGSPLSGTVVARTMANAVAYEGDPRREGDGVRLPLPAGQYKVSASASGYGTQTVVASAPADDVVIGLTPGGTLRVRSEEPRRRMARLLTPSGEEYIRCWCNRIAELRLEGVRSEFEHISAGFYTLVVDELDGGSNGYPVTINEGETTELRIP